MMKKGKLNIVAAMWPHAPRDHEVLGDRDHGGTGSSDSIWIQFRIKDDESFQSYLYRDPVRHIGLWVWFDDSGRYHLSIRLHDVYSMTVEETERALKLMRTMQKKVTAASQDREVGWTRRITEVLLACGIREVVLYRTDRRKEEYTDLNSLAQVAAREIGRRIARMPSSQRVEA